MQSIQSQVQAKQHERRGHKMPFDATTNLRIQGLLGHLKKEVAEHACITR